MSNKIHFVDQTIRDAQQSLWGLMMRTHMIAPIAETMDRVGYRSIATVGSQAFKGVQAMENVVSGKRYERIPDEVIKLSKKKPA